MCMQIFSAAKQFHPYSVQDTLESANTPHVFAAGDVCHNLAHPRPKAGVFAVRAGYVYEYE